MSTPPNTKTISIYLILMVMIISACLQPRSIAGQMPVSAGIATEGETPAMPAPTPALPGTCARGRCAPGASVDTKSDAAASPIPASPDLCTVKAELLNFRVGPGTGYEVTRVLKKGEILIMTGAVYGVWPGKWIEVTTARDETGWINSIFCEMSAK